MSLFTHLTHLTQQLRILTLLTVLLTLSHTQSELYAQPQAPEPPSPKPKSKPTSNDTPSPESAELSARAQEVVSGVPSFYAEARDVHADFKQTFTDKIYQRKKISTGKVFFQKPAQMRWDYEAPHQRLFIADGATLWVYEPEEAQVFKRDLASAQLPVALRFMRGEGKLTDDFNLDELTESEEGVTLTLSPKKPSGEYKALKLIVDPARFHVKASVLIDPVGNTNHISFVDAKVNSDLPDAGFSFTPPEGVRVIGG